MKSLPLLIRLQPYRVILLAVKRHKPQKLKHSPGPSAERGRNTRAITLVEYESRRHQYAAKLAHFFDNFDLLITPTLAQPPVDLGWLDMSLTDVDEYWRRTFEFSPFSVPFNLSGQPAISLPIALSSEGLPIGVQVIAPFGQDESLLAFSHSLETQLDWPKSVTSISS